MRFTTNIMPKVEKRYPFPHFFFFLVPYLLILLFRNMLNWPIIWSYKGKIKKKYLNEKKLRIVSP